MTRSTFMQWALDVGLSTARAIALQYVSQAQIDIWTNGLAEFRLHHHYTH